MAYNELPPGSVNQVVLGRNVYTYLQNGADSATGFISGNALGSQVQVALGMGINVANGLVQLNGSGVVPAANLLGRAATASVVASPTAPASTSVFAMQGLAGTITPVGSGRVKITISGTIIAPTSTTVNNGISYQISTGIGTAPTTNSAIAGTQVGPVQTYTSAIAPTAAADVNVPFSITYLVTGLTVGVPVWIDLAAKSITTVSAMALSAVGIVAIEL